MLLAHPSSPAAARLLIHAEESSGAEHGGFQNLLERLRALVAPSARHTRRVPLRLHIEDLHGRRMIDVDDVGVLLEVPLPAGTYRVNADSGKVRRSYTMNLEPGVSFDLHLRLHRRFERP